MTKVRITFKNYFSITYFYHLQYKCALRSQVYSFKIFVHFQSVEIIDINFHVKQVCSRSRSLPIGLHPLLSMERMEIDEAVQVGIF